MGGFSYSGRLGPRAILLLWSLVVPCALCFPGQAAGQSASEAYARRNTLLRAGLDANRTTLETVVEYAIALEGVWNEKTAGPIGLSQSPGTIPDKEYALNQAVQAGLQKLRSSIHQAVRLQGQADSTHDGKLALMLATDAASWTNRAIRAAQELKTPIVTYVPDP